MNEYPVVIYTKKSCGYCKLAKDLLDGEKMRYVEKDLDSVRDVDPEGHNVSKATTSEVRMRAA